MAVRGSKSPTSEFFVVYTGSQKWKTTTLRLSDSFLHKPPENSVELVVKIIKMHYNSDDKQSQKVLERSEKLRGYSLLLEYIKDYRRQGKDTKEAVNMAIQRCISEGILKDFLEKNSPEVGSMLFKEITSEEFAEIRAKEAAEEYYNKGRSEGIANLIAAYREFHLSDDQIVKKLMETYQMEEPEAFAFIKKSR